MRRIFLFLAALVLAGVSFGVPARAGSGEVVGTILGGGIGGVLGNQFGSGSGKQVATGIGILGGALIGNRIGNDIDARNRRAAMRTMVGSGRVSLFSDEMPQGQYVPNYVAPSAPDPASMGMYDASAGMYCREFVQPVLVGRRVQQSIGLVCQQPNGGWQVVQ
ncbi:MAG: glycine zipper 2TM domain-containing protein [Bdellovibrionales bacterium]